LFRGALPGMCVPIACDLETSTIKWPRPELGCKKEIGRYKRRRIISRKRMEYKKEISYFYMHCLLQLHFTDFLMNWLWKKSCEIHADKRVMSAEGFSLIITNYFLSFSSLQTMAQICSRHLILPHLTHLLICI
jgi:hypothetical protein